MTRPISMAVVLEGGLVQALLVEDWPTHIPLPRIAVVDYDAEGRIERIAWPKELGPQPPASVVQSKVQVVRQRLTDVSKQP